MRHRSSCRRRTKSTVDYDYDSVLTINLSLHRTVASFNMLTSTSVFQYGSIGYGAWHWQAQASERVRQRRSPR